jgi:hypothetical protein
MNLQKNDLIELNYGSNSIELAKIIIISNSTVEALNLSNLNKIILPLDELHLKEEITLQRMCPKYEEQMKMLGAKNLWVRLTRTQYKKINNLKEKSEPIKEIDDKQIENLKKWFLENKDEEKKEKKVDIFNLKTEEEINNNSINIFGDKEKTSPLSRFIKKI